MAVAWPFFVRAQVRQHSMAHAMLRTRPHEYSVIFCAPRFKTPIRPVVQRVFEGSLRCTKLHKNAPRRCNALKTVARASVRIHKNNQKLIFALVLAIANAIPTVHGLSYSMALAIALA